ncbi:hypothetical protein [Alcanivorax sp.]|jgi:hypothetical protein|uniref:hypothetical protein n=1 Tax=Alcanivorax sp. TaxID=1872427 RepID=UPI0032D9428B
MPDKKTRPERLPLLRHAFPALLRVGFVGKHQASGMLDAPNRQNTVPVQQDTMPTTGL